MALYYPQGVITLRILLEDFEHSSSARKQVPKIFTVRCKRLRVSLNSYKEADTFEADIDYKNFPFDPRIIRACGVSVFVEDQKAIFNLEQGRRLDEIVPDPNNIIFQGFVDTDRIQLSPDSRLVRLEGRDFTSLLIDREYFGDAIDTAQPVDKIIRALLDQLEQTKIDSSKPGSGLQIELQPPTLEIPTLAELQGSKDAMAAQKNSRRKRSYWDHIQELIENSGLIAYIAIDKLVITKPRNLYDKKAAKAMVYGRNLSSLEFSRKLGRQKGFNVRVVSLNVEAKELVEAKIPEEATQDWCEALGIKREAITIPTLKANSAAQAQSQTTGIKTAEANNLTPPNNIGGAETQAQEEPAPYFTFRIKDIADKDHLVTIGEKIFEELSRQQIEGKLSTKEMRVDTKAGGVFDAMKFRIGTPIEVVVDQGDVTGLSSIVQNGKQMIDQQNDPEKKAATLKNVQQEVAKFLRRRGYEEKIADAFAISLTRFNSIMFTKAVEFTLDQDQGFQMDIDFINFIEIPQNLVEPTLKK